MTIKTHTLVFNDFGVNTYILENKNKECIIIDSACSNDFETNQLKNFVTKNRLQPIMLINTHTHIDHVLGCAFIQKTFKIPWLLHKDAIPTLQEAPNLSFMFRITNFEVANPDGFLQDEQEISFGGQILKVLFTPGHADGSICLYIPSENNVFTGDVLFNGSIGRTDLPGGNFDTLIESIKTKLLTLPNETIVYPGHGNTTTIGNERNSNPFF